MSQRAGRRRRRRSGSAPQAARAAAAKASAPRTSWVPARIAALLPAAERERPHRRAPADEQRAHSYGAAELVGGDARRRRPRRGRAERGRTPGPRRCGRARRAAWASAGELAPRAGTTPVSLFAAHDGDEGSSVPSTSLLERLGAHDPVGAGARTSAHLEPARHAGAGPPGRGPSRARSRRRTTRVRRRASRARAPSASPRTARLFDSVPPEVKMTSEGLKRPPSAARDVGPRARRGRARRARPSVWSELGLAPAISLRLVGALRGERLLARGTPRRRSRD